MTSVQKERIKVVTRAPPPSRRPPTHKAITTDKIQWPPSHFPTNSAKKSRPPLNLHQQNRA